MPFSNKQLSFSNISDDFDKFFNQNQYNLLFLLEKHIHIQEFIPTSFYKKYYSKSGRTRKFSIESMLYAFIIKNILSIPSIELLITLFNISSELRNFCGFLEVPHKSQFSRFKTKFSSDLHDLFNILVDYTEALATESNEFLASILITDTTGFQSYVTENNPKFYQKLLKQSKSYAKKLAKDNQGSSFDPEKYTQSKMPKFATANPDSKLAYLNGHFGYFQKTVISTNGFGLIRDINFYDSENKLCNDLTPQGVKDSYDSKSLIPTLETFFQTHPKFSYKYFLGDSGFDADDNYAYLHNRQIMPIININPRNSSNLPQPTFNEFGVPLCPNDPTLTMVYDGVIRGKNRADRIKYICPKAKKTKVNRKSTYILKCDNPCTSSKCGRIKNITIHNNYRFNTSFPRDSLKWQNLYKIRTVCERTISQIKNFIVLKSSRIRNTPSLKSDILLASISQIISFIIMFETENQNTPLAIKSLIS